MLREGERENLLDHEIGGLYVCYGISDIVTARGATRDYLSPNLARCRCERDVSQLGGTATSFEVSQLIKSCVRANQFPEEEEKEAHCCVVENFKGKPIQEDGYRFDQIFSPNREGERD